jgi:hypothetical protein
MLFHGQGLGLEFGQVRLKVGDHLGPAPIAAAEVMMPAVVAARTVLAALSAAAAFALAAGSMRSVRMAVAAVAALMPMMSVPVVFACLAVTHDHALFRLLAERCSTTDSYSARNSSRHVLVLRISVAQISSGSRPTFVHIDVTLH